MTLKITAVFAIGVLAPSISATTSGCDSPVPIAPVWLLPETNWMRRSVVAGWRVTVICIVAELPTRSRPIAWITFGPIASGIPVAVNNRFATCAATPLTVTCACASLTVPTTMSLMLPEIVTKASVVANVSVGEVIVTCGGVVSSVVVMLAVLMPPTGVSALAVIRFGPSASGRASVKTPSVTTAGIELMVIVAVGSSTVPLTVVGLMLR